MTIDIEGVAGVVDDVKEESPPPADQSELISGLQDQLQNMQAQLKDTAAIKAEKDEVIDRFSKAVGFIEGSGTGKYDPTTGEIIKTEVIPTGPDPIETLKETIASTEKQILAQYKDGEITQAEYYEQLQETISPLKDQYRDMRLDNKLNKIKEDLKQETPPETPPPADKGKAQAYDKFAEDYPDISNSDSQLFKKMNDIYMKNSKLYQNANYDNGKGDPDQYRDLIERATIELKAEGIDVKKEQAAIRNKFATPGSKGYQEPEKSNDLSKQELGMIVAQGITSKALLSEINTAVGSWEQSGQMVMND